MSVDKLGRQARSRVETLLVVDDDPKIHPLIDFHLEGVVERILHEESALAGLRRARDSKPDVVLLDIEMPGMDGFEVCRELKRAEQTRDIPVLFLSAEMQDHQIARALDMGGADYVTKPFKSIVLQARVRVALRTKRVIDLLKKEAVVDGLTGLLSRRRFEEILMRRWSEAGTRDESVAVALLELDDFDSINDGLGHGVGDEVLIRVAKALQGSQRTDDIACRFRGGDVRDALAWCRTSRCGGRSQRCC
jgi:PleD family two-component response regulator